jgi:hypothetical protein
VKESEEQCELSVELTFGTGIYYKVSELKCCPDCEDMVTCLLIIIIIIFIFHLSISRYNPRDVEIVKCTIFVDLQ